MNQESAQAHSSRNAFFSMNFAFKLQRIIQKLRRIFVEYALFSEYSTTSDVVHRIVHISFTRLYICSCCGIFPCLIQVSSSTSKSKMHYLVRTIYLFSVQNVFLRITRLKKLCNSYKKCVHTTECNTPNKGTYMHICPPLPKVRSFWLELTLSLSIYILVKFGEKK